MYFDTLNKNIFKIWIRIKLIKYILGYLIISKYDLYKVLYHSILNMQIYYLTNILQESL